MGVDGQQDCPAGDADAKDDGGGDTSGLVSIGQRGEDQHEHQGDGVRRDSEELGLVLVFVPIGECRELAWALVYPRPLMMVGRNPPTLPSPRFRQE